MPIQIIGQSSICVFEVSMLPPYTIFPLDLGNVPTVRYCRFRKCSDSAVLQIQEMFRQCGTVDLGNVPTVRYCRFKKCSDSAVLQIQEMFRQCGTVDLVVIFFYFKNPLQFVLLKSYACFWVLVVVPMGRHRVEDNDSLSIWRVVRLQN